MFILNYKYLKANKGVLGTSANEPVLMNFVKQTYTHIAVI